MPTVTRPRRSSVRQGGSASIAKGGGRRHVISHGEHDDEQLASRGCDDDASFERDRGLLVVDAGLRKPTKAPSVATGGQLSAARPGTPPGWCLTLRQAPRLWSQPRPPLEPQPRGCLRRRACQPTSPVRGRRTLSFLGNSVMWASIESRPPLGEPQRWLSTRRSWQERRRCVKPLDTAACSW